MKCSNCKKEFEPKRKWQRHCCSYCRLKTYYKENPRIKQITASKFKKIYEELSK